MAEISIDNVWSVTISGSSRGLGVKNVNTVALLTVETPLTSFVYRNYKSPTAVGKDFGTDSDTYKMAVSLFSQNPNVLSANGALIIVPLLEDETISDAVLRLEDLTYAAGIITNKVMEDTELLDASDTVQALDHILLAVSSDTASIQTGGVFKQISDKGNFKTKPLLYTIDADKLKMMAAYAGRSFSTNFSGSLTTQTMNLKDLTGILPDLGIDQTLYDQAKDVGVDLYVSYEGVPKVVSNKNVIYFDSAYNRLWLNISLKVACFNTLAQLTTKIPQTEQGMDVLKSSVRQVLQQAVRNGFLAPGTWNSPDRFGVVDDLYRNVEEFGFYMYSLPISEQLQSEREERIAPLIQTACKEAGAIHGGSLIVNIEE